MPGFELQGSDIPEFVTLDALLLGARVTLGNLAGPMIDVLASKGTALQVPYLSPLSPVSELCLVATSPF